MRRRSLAPCYASRKYPLVAPKISLRGAPNVPARQVDDALESLRILAHDLTCNQGEDGSEACFELATALSLYDFSVQVRGESSADPSPISPHCRLVLFLDHMNSNRYERLLRSWSTELRIVCCMYYRAGVAAAKRHAKSVYIDMNGSSASVREFMIRLKTTKVDVDARGKPCYERKYSVAFEENLGDRKEGTSSWQRSVR